MKAFSSGADARRLPLHHPIIVPCRAVIALMMSRGDRCKVSVSGSEIARRFDSPMLSRITAQKAAEHASLADLASVARLKASRAARPAPATRSAGTGKSGLAPNSPPPAPGGVLRTAQTVSSHTPNRKPNRSHSANTARADLLMAIFLGTKLMRG
jgi:hypothetical protein